MDDGSQASLLQTRSQASLLQTTFRPEPIPRLQETYLTAGEVQLVATIGLLVVAVAAVVGFRRTLPRVRRRYGTAIAEICTVLGTILVVAGVVYAFTVIWHVTFVLEETMRALAIDRWTAAQQLVTAAVVLTAYLAMRLVNRSIDKLAETDALTNHQSEVAYHVSDVAIVAGAGTILLTLWGIDLTNIFIGAGAITAIVALTARQTLGAALAGFILLFARPFRVGDWIAINGTSGVVTDVTIFNTKVQTFGDEHVLVPNDEITDSQLRNYSDNDQLRVEVEVGVDYDTDLERARSVIVDAVSDLESIKDAPNPQVVVQRFDDSAIALELHVWIADPTKRRVLDARTDAIETITAAFDRAGIDIPYPQRVHAPRDDSGFPVDGPTPDEPSLRPADEPR